MPPPRQHAALAAACTALLVWRLCNSNTANYGDPAHVACEALAPLDKDTRADKSVLRVATFNAEWLFDGVDDPKAPWSGPADAWGHLRRVAAEVRAADADILNVAEVEGCFMLHRLAAEVSRQQAHAGGARGPRYTPHLAKGTDTSTRQQLGLLSRLAPRLGPARTERRESYHRRGAGARRRTTGVSKHYWAVFDVPGLGKELLVVAAHLKARPTDPASCAQREAQAAVLHALVEEHRVGRHVIVMGDMNDFDPDVADASGSTPTSGVVRLLGKQLGLRSAAEWLVPSDRWTWQGDGFPRSALDHVFLSPGKCLPVRPSPPCARRPASHSAPPPRLCLTGVHLLRYLASVCRAAPNGRERAHRQRGCLRSPAPRGHAAPARRCDGRTGRRHGHPEGRAVNCGSSRCPHRAAVHPAPPTRCPAPALRHSARTESLGGGGGGGAAACDDRLGHSEPA